MRHVSRVVAVFLVVLVASPAGAALADVGYQDQAFTGTGTPTGTKRSESLLWHNDGAWWANMWDPATADFHIFRLDTATQKWMDTGVVTDTRSNSHADVLWDGAHLYVASHQSVPDGQPAVSGYPSRLYRFSYDPATDRYSLDTGFPTTINDFKTETLVIDKDSTGKLWATWQQGNRIYVNRTTGDDRTWGTPFELPATGGAVTVDDASAVLAFSGNRIGVMWSDQTSTKDGMYFAVHRDGDPDGTWETSKAAIQGPGSADDHMNLKAVQADASGRVFAAVKTSFTSASAPLITLLSRDPATGDWTSYPVARVSDCPNRAIVLLDETNRLLRVYATFPAPPAYSCTSSGGAIHEKTAPLDAISFASGTGTPVMLDSDSAYVHNVTSTKQSVSAQTGLATLASNLNTGFYWHAFTPLGTAPQPVAGLALSATPISRTIRRGSSTTYSVTATPSGGFAGDVTYTVSGLPAGAQATWSKNPVAVTAGPVSSTLTVSTTRTSPTATASVTVTGSGAGLARTTTVTLQIKK